MKLKYIWFLSIILVQGCSKEEEIDTNKTDFNENEKIEVTIDLPENTSYKLSDLSLDTPFETLGVSVGTTEITKPELGYYTSFVSSGEGLVLMGYHGPGLSASEVNCESTLLSLVMGSMALFQLNAELKTELIPLIKQKSEFEVLSNQMQNRLENEELPIDTSSTAFSSSFNLLLNSLFEDRSINEKLRRALNENPPLNYRTVNNEVTFINPGYSFASVAGLYKDGNKIGVDKILGGVNFFPTNLGSVLSQTSSALGFTDLPIALNAIEDTFTLSGNGSYEIKVRTGCPKDFDALLNDEEALNALRENIASWAYTIILEIIPWDDLVQQGLVLGNTVQCLLGLIPEIVEGVTNLASLEPGISLGDLFGICMNVVGEVIGFSLTLAENCLGNLNGSGNSYSEQLERYTRFLVYLTIAGNSANLGVGLGQWFYKDARMDLCFEVNDGIANECEEDQSSIFREIQIFSDRALVFAYLNSNVMIINTTTDSDIAGAAVFDDQGYIISIDLGELGVTGIPSRFSELTRLKSFSSSGNPIVGFPNQINAPETLEFVSIIHTCNNDYYVFPEISNLPTTFLERHPKIKVFALAGTISSIPLELALHPSLESIGVESLGSFVPVPPEICDSGIFASTRSWSETTSSKKGSKSDCLLEEIGNDRCDD